MQEIRLKKRKKSSHGKTLTATQVFFNQDLKHRSTHTLIVATIGAFGVHALLISSKFYG